ncbi:MAG: SEC-C metal-binding domain-containing protein [Planctomycetes bacterium]|nr:SEC-C metal-binding domain-containing protein [Planctomycetota bacterium]
MEREDIVRDVLQAAGEFNSRKLWKRFTNYDCFGVRIAGQGEPMLGVVLGNAGEEYGLSLFRGPNAAASFAALLGAGGPGDDALEDMDMLGFSMDEFGSLPPDAQALLREAGQHPRYDEQVPHFLAKPSGQQGRVPNESELTLLGWVLQAVVETDKKKLLRPARLDDPEGIWIVNIRREGTVPQVSVTREKWTQEVEPTTVPLLATSHDLGSLPRLRATWLVGMPALPAGIKGDDRAMQVLLVVDDTDDRILQGRPVFSGDLRDAANRVMDTFRGKGLRKVKGLPREMVFSSRRLFDAMRPILEPLGVKCTYKAVIPKLQELVAEFYKVADGNMAPFTDELGNMADGDAETPAPDDLKGWKDADRRLYGRFVQHMKSDRRLRSTRAIKRYFNDDDLDYYVREHEKQGVLGAYMAWAILDYRPNKTSQTQAEKMLAEGLPAVEAILLRARTEACPTLYRVAGHDPKAGTIDLEDVLLGGRVTVYDQLMSENIENNVFFAARVFQAGHFHFVELAGPPLGAGMGLEAVEFLRGCGMEFTPEGRRRDAHMFGWLWQWMDQWQANRKSARLCNTDGEEFLWHIASFSVANPDETRKTLMKRKDIDYDEEADELVWNKKAGPGRQMMGDTITLSRIEFVGDELVLTVNSAKRFARARQWLEKLPGVAFKSVRTRRWNEAEKERPLDERIAKPEPVEMTPELNAAIQDMMNKHYMAWTDMPLPALAGRTPRQACRTEEGRQQVLMLIRTMPDPMGPGSVCVPREAMLRELGLTTESPTPAPADQPVPRAPIPIESVPPKPRVPRNAPCPCGSGRKYKKCCGRGRG